MRPADFNTLNGKIPRVHGGFGWWSGHLKGSKQIVECRNISGSDGLRSSTFGLHN
jgi:hypothetical protein